LFVPVEPGVSGAEGRQYSADGRQFMTQEGGTLAVWDVGKPDKPRSVLRSEIGQGARESASLSPTGRHVFFTVAYDVEEQKIGPFGISKWKRPMHAAYLWHVDQPDKPPTRMSTDWGVMKWSFSPSDKRIVAVFENGVVRSWGAEQPGADPVVLRGHDGRITSATISPDGQQLLTAGEDGTARLWDVEHPNALPVILRGNGRPISAAFSPDGRWVVTTGQYASNGNTAARLWLIRGDDLIRLAGRTLSRNLTRDEWNRYMLGAEYRTTFDHLPIPK
jgi:WD40 repeat protein